MANKTPLASWLYSQKNLLNPQFQEMTWPSRYCPGIFDFSTKIHFDGFTAEGCGVDTLREIALEKSVAEAIERLVCLINNFDSVGVAVSGLEEPIRHARYEAFERACLKWHLEKTVPFKNVETSFLDLINPKVTTQDHFCFYQMRTPEEFFGIVCMIQIQSSNKYATGFAFTDSIDSSIRRSYFEALPNYAWLLDNSRNTAKSDLPWHLQPDFVERLLKLSSSSLECLGSPFDLPNLVKADVDLSKLPFLQKAPIFLSRFVVKSGGVG